MGAHEAASHLHAAAADLIEARGHLDTTTEDPVTYLQGIKDALEVEVVAANLVIQGLDGLALPAAGEALERANAAARAADDGENAQALTELIEDIGRGSDRLNDLQQVTSEVRSGMEELVASIAAAIQKAEEIQALASQAKHDTAEAVSFITWLESGATQIAERLQGAVS